ncbi:hypothetical protein HAZT_HAZT001198 [Hyalella azteca]|uniref:Alpha-amylase n=1 Tax=Hyalella azteca TaxID=294128 RepID=A0A6A0GY24_HYAAZ|nr:hypothetical protein HAZT_HAZT001198 [Hyalella azteca]
MEHLVIPEGTSEPAYPWWQRYQPISYKFESRSGNHDEFVDMVQRCNAVGVRIFVDAVVNHMAGLGRSGTGSGGSSFDSDQHDFPGVPYTDVDFTPREMCNSGDGNVNNYGDPENVRNCNLVGLTDLYGASSEVRQKVADYFSSAVDIGVAGFRVDAAKHMWPDDLKAMMDLTNNLNTDQGFPANTRPFFYHEVIDRNDGAVTVQQYYGLGRITEFRYCQKITWGIDDFSQLWGIYDPGWGMADPDKAFVFVDNHDNQRGHGGAGDTITYKQPHNYRLGVAFTLAQPYGFTRIMSSYDFGTDTDVGPPHKSDWSTDDVVVTADGQCSNGWVRFRNAVAGALTADNKYNDGNVVAFSRGNLGFFAMIKQGTLSMNLQTGMPAGTYSELVTCADVTVNGDGTAQITITNEEEPIFAICQGCSCDDAPIVTATQGPGCTDDVTTDPCAIDHTVNSLGTTTHYDKYNAWSEGDTKLDWFGAEAGQGTYGGQAASGTPLAWTSSNPSNPGYQPLNKYGDHYWMLDVDMDCSQTEQGWFELKAFVSNSGDGWEGDIAQAGNCKGAAGGSAPYATKNHVGRCGYLNVFSFDSGSCTVEILA